MEEEIRPIFGTRPVLEALNFGKIRDKVFIQNGLNTDIIRQIKSICNKKGITIKYVPKEKLDSLTQLNHQGVYSFLSPIEFYDLESHVQDILDRKQIPFILVLDGIKDVRNFGAIIRTAECVGINAIVIPNSGVASINADTVKTSTGAVFNVPICKVRNLTDSIVLLKQFGVKIIAATEKSSKSIFDVGIEGNIPLAIVFGNEEKGISNQILKISDDKAKLPILGKIGSLNVSVAVGAFCYEILRRKYK